MTDIHGQEASITGMRGPGPGFGIAGQVHMRRRVFMAEGDL